MTGVDDILLNFSPTSLTLLNAILAVVMFSIALDLNLRDFHAFVKAPKPVIAGFIAQFLVLPALTFLLVLVAQPAPSIALGLILVAACPGGNISNFITHRAGGNTALSVSLTAFASVAAIVLTPFNVALWGGLYPPTREILRAITIDPGQVAVTVGLMLALPLALGMALNTWRPKIAQKIHPVLQIVSMLIFLGFIVVSLQANWVFFKQFAGAVAALVIAHNAIAFLGGNLTARAMGLSEYNRRSVTIETGIQNSGLGLILIFAFFGGLGGMAVVAALWGIWHAISGLVLASWWSRTEAAR